MRLIFSIFVLLMPVTTFSQIGREFKFEKINGDTVKSTELEYENTLIDKTGMPILPKKANFETINFYQGGYVTQSKRFKYKGKKRELSKRIILSRVDSVVRQAEVYTFYNDRESLLRAHDAKIENGKIISEKIRDEKNKNIGSVKYSYGKTSKGLNYEWIDAVGNRGSRKYYTETDKHGVVFSMETFEKDTLISFKRLEERGDTLNISLLVSKRGANNSPDSILVTVRKWFDDKGNPTLVLTKMEALTKPPPGEPKKINYVSSISYEYGKSALKAERNFLNQSDLLGAWRSEPNNIELFFEPKRNNGEQRLYGSSYLLKSNEPTIEQYLNDGEIWKFMFKQDYKPSTWSIDEDGTLKVILSNESVLSFSAYLDYNMLVLKPKMKDMKGELRLVK